MEELCILLVAILLIGGAVAMYLDHRAQPRSGWCAGGLGWVRAGLFVTRVVQGLIVLLIVVGVLLSLVDRTSLNFSAGGGAVSLRGDGLMTVRGQPGYMDGLCSGERGPPGGFTQHDLCPQTKKVTQAFGRRVTVDHVVFTKTDPHPGLVAKGLVALAVAGLAAYLALLSSLAQILKRAAAGRPFAPESVRSLRMMAAALLVGVSVVPGISNAVARSIVETQLGAEAVSNAVGRVPLWPWVFALMLLALAEVWRYGVRLQEEAEATV